MGADKARRKKISARMASTGESYTEAMRAVDAEHAASTGAGQRPTWPRMVAKMATGQRWQIIPGERYLLERLEYDPSREQASIDSTVPLQVTRAMGLTSGAADDCARIRVSTARGGQPAEIAVTATPDRYDGHGPMLLLSSVDITDTAGLPPGLVWNGWGNDLASRGWAYTLDPDSFDENHRKRWTVAITVDPARPSALADVEVIDAADGYTAFTGQAALPPAFVAQSYTCTGGLPVLAGPCDGREMPHVFGGDDDLVDEYLGEGHVIGTRMRVVVRTKTLPPYPESVRPRPVLEGPLTKHYRLTSAAPDCPECGGTGVTGDLSIDEVQEGRLLLAMDVLCPACGAGLGGTASDRFHELLNGSPDEEDEAVDDPDRCPSCHDRGWYPVTALAGDPHDEDELEQFVIVQPCGCSEPMLEDYKPQPAGAR